MGAYDPSRRDDISLGRGGVGNLTDRIETLRIADPPMSSLIQVIGALEDAENHIKHQLEENNRLKDELKQKTFELEKYYCQQKSDTILPISSSRAIRANHSQESSGATMWMENGSSSERKDYETNGNTKLFTPNHQPDTDNPVSSQLSYPSSTSVSPSRQQKDAEYGARLMQIAEVNASNSLVKQELLAKVKEHEEEIVQLRRRLTDFSIKEAHIRNEKYVLEKRISHMRLAFDQQQQDLVDAASKALSYRQEIIEENIRLTYALQEAQQEKSTFVSSLMPLLTDYNFHPSVSDAISITSNIKVLFKHLQEKLLIAEEKLKDSQYQLTSWHADTVNVPHGSSGLEIVPQHPYRHVQSPIPSPSRAEIRPDWDGPRHEANPGSIFNDVVRKVEHELIVKSSPGSRSLFLRVFSSNHRDPPRNNVAEDPDAGRTPSGREALSNWPGGENSPYLSTGADDATSSYPYLPPVPEEPGSSISEAAEDDPSPAIEGLQIAGEAFPGNQLQACGYSINGTTSCNFEWVRFMEDGSFSYIEGAMQPTYLVTADDVDCLLAIEVLPLDDRRRKGELVRVFANEQRQITCDPEMQEEIAKIYHAGQASFTVSLSAGALNIWENAVLAIKREGYSIKASGTRGIIVAEKFSPNAQVMIPVGYTTEFFIQSSSGIDHVLKANNSRERDMMVLTLRLFIKSALEKKRGKKKALFF